MTLSKFDEGIYLDVDTKEQFNSIDSIIFDCDGVLIDVTESYDLTIKKTVDYILKEFAKISNPIQVDAKIIDGFKATGGFNDEVDLAYAAILSIYAANNLGENQFDFVFKVIENSNETGIISVEKYLENLTDISQIKTQLDYPGKHGENPLYVVFDQFFYGPDLFLKLFNKESQFSEKGLIENDKVIVTTELTSQLKKRFNDKISIVTGRGLESIKYPLKNILNEFNTSNSFFLEDESRELAKPNPESLIRAISGLESDHCLYVGDSFEDFIMAKKATESGNKTTFCGIIGTSKEPQKKLKLFEEKDALIVLDSINLLPKVLNQV